MPFKAITRTLGRTNLIYAAIVAFLVLLYVLGALVMARAVASETLARRIGEETQKTLALSGSLLITLLDAETSQRGYLLAGEPEYLKPFSGKRAEFAQQLAALREQVRREEGAALYLESLDHVAQLSTRRFDLLDQGIAERDRNDIPAMLDLIKNGGGKAAMDGILIEVNALRAFEEERLAQAFARARTLQGKTAAALGFLLVVTFVTLIIAGTLVRRTIRAESEAQYAQKLRAERDRADLISRELSHRVKNLFAVIMSIVSTTGRAETDPREAARKIRERVQALARAHSLSGGQNAQHAARLEDLVNTIIQPYVPLGREVALSGPEIWLSADRVTPVGLILNELATNALKYGAWASPNGTLAISWAFDETQQGPDRENGDKSAFRLEWQEKVPGGGVADPDRQGFGTQMIELSAIQARAGVEKNWQDGGLDVVLRFEGDSPARD